MTTEKVTTWYEVQSKKTGEMLFASLNKDLTQNRKDCQKAIDLGLFPLPTDQLHIVKQTFTPSQL